ncbi:hypothetical protein Tco_1063933 [Tanacetum coccineum]
MVEEQAIVYAPQWNNMTVDNMTFQTNNVVGNFNYPPNVPAYKPIMKFLLNCPLNKAFTNCPSVLYQNYLREFWSTVVPMTLFHQLMRLSTVPDLQDLERNIQLVDTGLPSTLDEGTRKSQPLPKGTTTGPKDSGGNDQPADKGLPSMASNEGTDKTTPRPEGPLGDKDSWGHKTPVDIEPIHPTIIDPSGTGAKY